MVSDGRQVQAQLRLGLRNVVLRKLDRSQLRDREVRPHRGLLQSGEGQRLGPPVRQQLVQEVRHADELTTGLVVHGDGCGTTRVETEAIVDLVMSEGHYAILLVSVKWGCWVSVQIAGRSWPNSGRLQSRQKARAMEGRRQ